MTLIPSSPSASAAPDFELRLRLPCLATGTPAPATTKAVAVEMLSVPFPSPPVPTMSIAPSGAFTAWHLDRITAAAAANSSTVSPRVRKAMRKPPIWAGVASPLKSSVKAVSASERLRGRSAADPMRGFRVWLMPAPLPYQEMFSTSYARARSGSIRGETERHGSATHGVRGP